MGSFWFAALVVQNLGYYVIAALFLPVGIGHVKIRRWALTLTQLYLWFWLGAGLLFFGHFVWLIPAVLKLDIARDTMTLRLSVVGSFSFLFLVSLPSLALWFYRSEKVKSVFKEHDPNNYWTERYPFPLLALLLLYIITILVLHLAIFFQSLFPVFGQIMLGRPAVYIISFCILILGFLIYGTVRLKKWAWWGALGFVSLLTISTLLSFAGKQFYDIVMLMSLPAYELEFLGNMPLLQDVPVLGLFSMPLLAALGLVIYSRRNFLDGDT
jgi:hypothetical protein